MVKESTDIILLGLLRLGVDPVGLKVKAVRCCWACSGGSRRYDYLACISEIMGKEFTVRGVVIDKGHGVHAVLAINAPIFNGSMFADHFEIVE